MTPTSSKDMMKALSIRLAQRELPAKVLEAAAARIVAEGLTVVGVDFCPYGICIDYFSERMIAIDPFVRDKTFRVVKLFPYGVLADDLFRLQVEMHVPELAEYGIRG